MINLYTGTVGSGKSFHALEVGLENVKRGCHCIANFPIKAPDKYLFKKRKEKWETWSSRWLYFEEISVPYLMGLSIEKGWFGKEGQCIVIIDEAGILFNSRDWQIEREQRQGWLKFLSQSRKFGYDFIFVCQADRMIDRQIRGFVEYEVKHRKLNNSKFFGFLSLFHFTVFMYVYKWYGTRVKSHFKMSYYRSWIAKRYDTMRIFNLDELVDAMRKIFEGKIIPAHVASQIAIWEDQIRAKAKIKDSVGEKQKSNA